MIEGAMLRDAMVSGSNNIAKYRGQVNDLNIFPVPDGDTGSNMSMTIGAASDELLKLPDTAGAGEVAAKAAAAMLRGARGNSGVILSLLFRGISKGLEGVEAAGCEDILRALDLGVEAAYNAVTMKGNYSEMLQDGVVYRLLECDDVEKFADHELYLSVIGGSTFYDRNAYVSDEETGKIHRNSEYNGLNALFRLPIDASKANPEEAERYLGELGSNAGAGSSKGAVKIELGDDFAVEAASGNEKGAEAAEYALEFVGNPYVWNGESLTEGCDSSGFTKGVYEHFGVSLPHAAAKQKDLGQEVDGIEDACPGDLIFYDGPSHVAVYIGDNKIVHADTQLGICVSEADFAEIVMIRRILR